MRLRRIGLPPKAPEAIALSIKLQALSRQRYDYQEDINAQKDFLTSKIRTSKINQESLILPKDDPHWIFHYTGHKFHGL